MRNIFKVIIILSPLFTFHVALAQTPIYETISGNTTWSPANSPYILSDTITIPSGSTLTIEPGTTITLNSGATLSVSGIISALGTTENPITFTSTQPNSAYWSLNIMNSGRGTFAHTNFSDLVSVTIDNATARFTHSDIVSFYGILAINNSDVTLDHYHIHNVYSNALEGDTNSSITATAGTISNINIQNTLGAHYGIVLSNGATGDFTDLTLTNCICTSGIVAQLGATLSIASTSISNTTYGITSVSSTLTIASSTMSAIGATALYSIQSTTTATDLTITSARSGIVASESSLTIDGATLSNIYGEYGISIADSTAHISHSTLKDSPYASYGILVQSGTPSLTLASSSISGFIGGAGIYTDNGQVAITDSTITHNATGLHVFRGEATIDQSSIQHNISYGIFNNGTSTVYATNNYWGSATGPTHSSNPAGTGDRVSDNVTFTPWLAQEPSTTTAPTCVTDCYSNVLFLPGLEASRLFWTEPNCFIVNCENQLWLANSDADAEKLYLNPSGTSILSDIYTSVERGAIDEAAIPVAGTNIYKTFLNSLNEWKNGEHLIADYVVAPYDWRLSVDDVLTKGIKKGDNIYYGGANGTYILDELLRMASTSKTQKVTIVAHSNGGLVAKQLMLKLRELGKEDLVDRLILVAVPQVGTPKAVGGLLHGTGLGITGILDEEHARTLGENMPSAYALMPSQKYFETVNPNSVTSKLISFTDSPLYAPERSQYGFLVSNMTELRGYLLGSEGRTEPADFDLDSPNVLKSELLDQASSTHALLDEWQPASTTEVVQIAGWGEKTISGVSYYTEQQRDCVTVQDQFGASHQECGPYYEVKKYKPNFTAEGDGTVVVPSALWMATSTPRVERYWVDLLKHNSALELNIDRDHKNITEVITLLDFIKNKLTNSTSSLPKYIVNSTSALSDVLSTQYVYTLHSPLTLDLYDTFGKHTGISTTTGYAEENIPGSRYGAFGEVKYIIANTDVAQHLELRGYATGTFSLDIEKVQGDVVLASTTFASVSVSPNTIATFSLPANADFSSSTPLRVDVDGNGTNDILLVPEIGATVYPDFTPPEAVFSFNPATKDLTISGRDAEGTTSTRTSTTSVTITDKSGNTLTIPLIKFKEKATKLKVVFDTFIYNGVATTTPRVTLEYEWELKNNVTLKSLTQDIRIKGVRRVTADYSLSKNETKIVDRIKEDGEKSVAKTTKVGVVAITLSSLGGVLGVVY